LHPDETDNDGRGRYCNANPERHSSYSIGDGGASTMETDLPPTGDAVKITGLKGVERFALLLDSREAIVNGGFDTGHRRANRGGFDADKESIGALYDGARRLDGSLTFRALPSIVDDGEHRNTKAAESEDVTKDVSDGHGSPFSISCVSASSGGGCHAHANINVSDFSNLKKVSALGSGGRAGAEPLTS
jgi:hypothetical protein